MAPTRRTRLFVDFSLQSTIILRVVLYWFYCLLSVALFAACWIVYTEQPHSSPEIFRSLQVRFGPALVGSALLLPLVLMDCLRLSNRFVGPLLRAHHALKQMSQGIRPQPIRIRKHDFWRDFIDDLNRVIEQFSAEPVSVSKNDRPSPAESRESTLAS